MRLRSQLFALAVLVLVGCHETDGQRQQQTTDLGSVEGYVYAPPGTPNAIVLGHTDTPPPGHAPVRSATVSVEGRAGTRPTDADGHFRIDAVAPGLRRLLVTPSGGAQVEFPLTVLSGATIRVGPPTVSREQAIDIVEQEIDASLPLPMELTTILGPQQPLPTGTLVEAAFAGNEDGTEPVVTFQAPSPHWFFFVDQIPTAPFAHPVTYYFVDAETGQLTTQEQGSWPFLNGRTYYAEPAVNIASPDLIRAPTRTRLTSLTSVTPVEPVAESRLADHVPNCTNPRTHVLVIKGFIRGDFDTDFTRMKDFAPRLNAASRRLYEPPQTGSAIDGLATIRQKFRELCSFTNPCDTVIVSIHTHGNPNGTEDLQQGPVDDGNGTKQSKVKFRPALVFQNEFKNCKACHFVFILDSCHSGKAMEELASLVTKLPNDFRGKKFQIFASCKADEVAHGGSNPDPPGSYFLRHFVSGLDSIINAQGGTVNALTSAQFTSAFNQAIPPTVQETAKYPTRWNVNTNQFDPSQHPTMWEKPMQPGETCNASGVATRWGVDLDRDLTIGSTVHFKAGEKIPLACVKGWKITENEPGCPDRHLHAVTSSGITVEIPGQESIGPIPDPNQTGCGYGKIVDLPFN
ncbi:MAG: hypothetical protein ACYSX0_05675 [Planctomycetota bacterium]|jgi:hypothetical protein